MKLEREQWRFREPASGDTFNAMTTAKTRPENKNALLRMWELLKLLPQREPGKTAGELHKALEARGYSVDKKTVERDLTNLSTILPITCDEETRPYRWYWMPDRSLGLPGVALTEAIALVLVEKSLTGLVHHNLLEPLQLRLEAARRLIAESSPRNRQAAWTEKVIGLPRDLAHQPPAVKPEVFSEVQQALLTDRQLEIEYKSFTSDAPRWRTVNPHALLLKAPVTYLVATEVPSAADPKPIAKQFALHRMRGARVTAKPVVPGSFKLSRYLKSQAHEVGSNRPIRVRLKVHSKSLQTLLQEVPFARTQRIKVQGGDFIVEAAVRESQALRRWILARGPEVTVLAPASLRKTIQNSLQAAAATYLG